MPKFEVESINKAVAMVGDAEFWIMIMSANYTLHSDLGYLSLYPPIKPPQLASRALFLWETSDVAVLDWLERSKVAIANFIFGCDYGA